MNCKEHQHDDNDEKGGDIKRDFTGNFSKCSLRYFDRDAFL